MTREGDAPKEVEHATKVHDVYKMFWAELQNAEAAAILTLATIISERP